jgi:hypothetical protein
MFKKILLSSLLVLIIGALVFGAVTRTLAMNRSGDGSGQTGSGSGNGRGAQGGAQGAGQGTGQGAGQRGNPEAGSLSILPPAAPGDLTDAETADLLYMREEEKLAHDVYVTLYAQWSLPIFQNIANSEAVHMDSLLTLLDRYGLADPASSQVGVFTNPDLQALYTQLVARGSSSLSEALKVGSAIEEIDILDLDQALANTSRADLQQVYTNLRHGSENHLRSFAGTLQTQTGETYQPQYLSQDAYQAIFGSGSGYGNSGGQGGGRGGRGGRP